MTQAEYARNLSGERLKEYRKTNRLSQKVFADKLKISDQTLARYEKGTATRGLPSYVIKRLSEVSDYIPEYWQGITKCKTRDEYLIWCKEYADMEREIDNETADWGDSYEDILHNRMNAILDQLDYSYEYLSVTHGNFDFIQPGDQNYLALSPEEQQIVSMMSCGKTNKITERNTGDVIYITDDELDDMLSTLQAVVSFECYKKTRRKE